MQELGRLIFDLKTEIAVLKEHISGTDEALKIQAEEYARRLDELNGAHELARQTLVTYIPKTVYDTRVETLDTRITKLELAESRRTGQLAIIGFVVGFISTVGTILISKVFGG